MCICLECRTSRGSHRTPLWGPIFFNLTVIALMVAGFLLLVGNQIL